MAPRPSGWYDDPDDDTQLRYWDGIVWTDHVVSRRPPAPAPEPAAPAGPQDRRPFRGPVPEADPWRGSSPAGVPALAGWWQRVAAYVVDMILLWLVCLPLTLPRVAGVQDEALAWWRSSLQEIERGATGPSTMPQSLVDASVTVSLIQLVAYLVLEVVFLAWRGATPGRMLVGIRVCPADHPDRTVPAPAGLRRTVVKRIAALLAGIPVISLLARAFQIVDYLWPLRDPRRQALHDRAAGTLVVRGRLGADARRRGAHRG